MPVRTEVAPADIGVPYGYDETTARLPEPLAYSPDGGLLAIGNSDGGVTLCDTETGLPVRTLRGHQDRVYSTRFALGGRVLVTAASDATLRLWDVSTGECTVTPVPGTGAWPGEVSPDGELFAYGAPDGVVRVLHVASGEIRRQLPGHASLVYTAAFAGGGGPGLHGRRLLTGDQAGIIRVWDLDSENLLTRFSLPEGAVYRLLATGIASARGGPLFAAAGAAGTLLLIDEQGQVTRLAGHADAIYALDIHPSRPLLASGDTKGEVQLSDLATRSQRTVLASHPDAVYGLTFSPDGSQLASACLDGLVRITAVADGRIRHELTAHRSAVWRPLFRPDGTQLATASIDGTCRLWDTATGQPRNVVRGHGRRVTSVTFSADGGLLAAGGNDGGVYLLNADTGMRDRKMNMETERVYAVAFSPDGTLLASAGNDGAVRLWSVPDGTLLRSLEGHTGRVAAIAFSSGVPGAAGPLLASASDDGTVRLWEVAAEPALRVTLLGTSDGWAAFAADGRYKADGAMTGQFWHVIGSCRFEPGELDPYVPGITQLPADVPF